MTEFSRLASEDDLKQFLFLKERALEEVKTKRGGEILLDVSPLPEKEATEFLTYIDSDRHDLIVGLFEEAIVGYGKLEYSTTNSNKKLASVKEVFVMKEARSVGVGESMMNFMIQRSKSLGCTGIDGFALPGDRETKNFFESQGMVARLIKVYSPLESD